MATASRDQLRDFARAVLKAIDENRLSGVSAAKVATWVRNHVPPARGPTRGAASRVTDPSTSADAAAKVAVTELESQVLAALRVCPGGATTHHLAQMTGLRLESVAPRMAPLERAGYVRDSGERRETTPGHSGIVWLAVQGPA